jgi:hypothetical protein
MLLPPRLGIRTAFPWVTKAEALRAAHSVRKRMPEVFFGTDEDI